MYALSPAVNTVPAMLSTSRPVASTPGLPQYPISPAPTSTPLGADPGVINDESAVGAAGDEQLIPCNRVRARTIRQIRRKERFWRNERTTRRSIQPRSAWDIP